MSSYYVVKTNERFYFFYCVGNDLVCRMLDDGHTSPETCLLRHVHPYFTVITRSGGLCILCRDENGVLWLLNERDGTWNNRALKPFADAYTNEKNMRDISTTQVAADENTPMRIGGTRVTDDSVRTLSHFGHARAINENASNSGMLAVPLFTETGLNIVYNAPSDDGPQLFTRSIERGEWSQAARVDCFLPFNGVPFETQSTSSEHMLLFYQSRADENQIGYREFTTRRIGTFQRIHSAEGQYADTSFLTTNDAVHALYIVKTFFSCQLLYRRRMDTAFEAPLLLWEAPRIDQCLLSYVRGNLYATCLTGGQLHIAVSDNHGASFVRMTPYRRKFCVDPVKAVYVTCEQLDERELFVRQVYVDRDAPWDIQMLPDLYDTLYEFPYAETPVTEPETPKDVLNDLQDRLAAYEHALNERDKQIMALMLQVKSRDE